MATLDEFWGLFKKTDKALKDKKKKDKFGLGKTRGGKTDAGQEALDELEKGEKYASNDEE